MTPPCLLIITGPSHLHQKETPVLNICACVCVCVCACVCVCVCVCAFVSDAQKSLISQWKRCWKISDSAVEEEALAVHRLLREDWGSAQLELFLSAAYFCLHTHSLCSPHLHFLLILLLSVFLSSCFFLPFFFLYYSLFTNCNCCFFSPSFFFFHFHI